MSEEKAISGTDKKNSPVNYHAILLILILVSGLFSAGCIQQTASPSGGIPSAISTPALADQQDSQYKEIKDSEHRFSLRVPVAWDVKTYRLKNADSPEGFIYQTDLLEDNKFFIVTYSASRIPDPGYAGQFRNWSPRPKESAAEINGIPYDRFESSSPSKTSVAYIARKSSANEGGYINVIAFTANRTSGFEKEDLEKIAGSFRYFSGGNASLIPGEEIPRTNPPFTPPKCSCNCGCPD